MSYNKLSEDAFKLILKYEVGGGKSYYDKFLSKFTWPQGASGPTIGIGVDCAYYSPQELRKIFNFLSHEQIELIVKASGKTGQQGKEYTKILRNKNITVSWEDALKIFEKLTLPKFTKLAEKTFPGLSELCDNAYGAIISLVFNRGTSLNGESRFEMRNIKDLVVKKNYKGIAREIRRMKRLWQGKGLDGLLERRESEAKLVETCI
jgi:GH24 family phage-related lysozyme (muramidase)